MHSYLGSALFSASDLVNFTGCRHCTFLDLRDLLNGEDFKGAVTALTAIALAHMPRMKELIASLKQTSAPARSAGWTRSPIRLLIFAAVCRTLGRAHGR